MATEKLREEIHITKEELQAMLASAAENAARAARVMTPLEQERYDEEMKRRENKNLAKQILIAAHAHDPDGTRKKNCTHSRHPMAMGKLGGSPCDRGRGEWTTGAQMHGNGTATVVCQRCCATWTFEPSPNEIAYILDGGGSSLPPPGGGIWPGTDPRIIHP